MSLKTIKKACLIAFSNIIHLVAPTLPKLPVIPIQIERTLGIGIASVYGNGTDGFLGKLTASGERLTSTMLTVAHKTLPFGTILKIINLENGKFVFAKVTDRGPYVAGRVLDLNSAVAKSLNIKGLTKIEYRTVEYAH